jgi:RNA polymerase sigma factor (TIGR02999 family)
MSTTRRDVTTLLQLVGDGDRPARDALFRVVEAQLRKRAKARMRQERPGHILQTTVLIDDAFVKLVGARAMTWQNRSQFYRCAAQVMREILVDEARRRAVEKRGGGQRPVSLNHVADPVARRGLDPLTLLAVHEALNKLTLKLPELMQIVELHVFGGWQLREIAEEILHLPYGTIKRKWHLAKAMLHREIGGTDDA